MTRQDFLRHLEHALERPPHSFTEDTQLAEAEWDSLGELTFTALADQHLRLRVSPQTVSDCTSMSELLDLLKPKIGT